jgi:hypothetical protein
VTANDLTRDFLFMAAREFPDAFMWRNNRVKAKALGRDGHLRTIDAGIDGQGDITGCIPVTILGHKLGVRCEIEIKAANDRQRPSQIAFEQALKRSGGIYLIVRDAAKGIECLRLLLRDMEKF